MRDYLITEILKDLYGPKKGPCEELEIDPFKEYIIGVIVPRNYKESNNPDSEETISETDDDNDSEVIGQYFPGGKLNPAVPPKSFGLTFYSRTCEFDICVTWGTYSYNKEKKIWKRTSWKYIKKISEDMVKLSEPLDMNCGIKLYIDAHKDSKQNYLITVFVANENNLIKNNEVSTHFIYQPSIRINIKDFQNNVISIIDEDKDSEMDFLYRERKTIAKGHRCSAIWKCTEYSSNISKDFVLWVDGIGFPECKPFEKPDIRTEFIPVYPESAPLFNIPDMKSIDPYQLSELWSPEDINGVLSPLLTAYKKWHEQQRNFGESGNLKNNKISFNILDKQQKFLTRLQDGIELLKNDDNARLAFCFANRAIYQENVWLKKYFKWRPFQLAFMITTLESILNPKSSFEDYVDLLWAPTGSGKTEAYLALSAYTIALRRLKFDKAGYGTAIITRYTLRLLTIQQFRRTIALVIACEYLRVEKRGNVYGWRPEKYPAKLDGNKFLYGSMRFSIGMWVGTGISPNHIEHAINILKGKENEISGNPAQLLRCPVCDSILAFPEIGKEDKLDQGKELYLIFDDQINIPDLDAFLSKYQKKIDYKYISDYTYRLKARSDIPWEEQLWVEFNKQFSEHLLSVDLRYPGYIKSGIAPGKRNGIPYDFEIYCPNPGCELNQVEYAEGVPFKDGTEISDGYYFKSNPRKGMPIPVYTVDDQIYARCPTIIIGTVDKIARLAFEPHAASMTGNVNMYNKYYGFYRRGLEPYHPTEKSMKDSIAVCEFRPPDLIIQDELHLIDGPLGSMYGLYEAAFEALIKRVKGQPKYIASTATIKNADLQSNKIFARKIFQFPPHGLNINDNFFIRYLDTAWDEEKSGKIYMGISSTGFSQITFLIRVISRLLKSTYDKVTEPNSKYYWTNVVYFNAMKELAVGTSTYYQDVKERLEVISKNNKRELDPERFIELSSRISSMKIPQLIDELEGEGNNADIIKNHDALFTTAMFGTGIDIPHLSTMVVNGQPKTTSQYIQATGRIGRSHGGLVITLLNPSKSRDITHYEYFIPYHNRIHQYVEPVSVSPFSPGCIDIALGPAMISFLRNKTDTKIKWLLKDGKVINDKDAGKDIEIFKKIISQRSETNGIRDIIGRKVERWKDIAATSQELLFNQYIYKNNEKEELKDVVLGDPLHERQGKKVVYKDAPQSLRNVEETIDFQVD